MLEGMTTDKIIKGLATIVMIAAIVAVVGYLWQVVVYIAAAAVFALLGRRLVSLIASIKVLGRNISRNIAAAITLLVIWLVVGAMFALFVPLILDKTIELSSLDWVEITSAMRQALVDAELFIEQYIPVDVPSLEGMFKDRVFNFFNIDLFADVAGLAVDLVIAFFSISFITFFFLREDGLFYRMVALFFPEHYSDNVHRALDSITKLLSRYFSGLVVESFIIMLAISLVLMLFGMGMGDALVVGLIMGVMNVIPYAGPFIGGCLSIALSMLTPIDGAIPYTIIVVLSTIIVVKFIDDFIIQPTLYSERIQAHPLEVFLVILIAGFIGGVWGMLLAIPLYTIVRVLAREFFSEYSVVRKLTSQMTK